MVGRRATRGAAAVASLATLAAAACVLPDIDLSSKACPCADGYVCDEATQRCGVASAAVPDGSRDAPPADAPAADVVEDAGAQASFCSRLSPAPSFCADFDTENLPYAWDPAELPAEFGVTVALDPRARTAPRALRVRAPSLDSGKQIFGYLHETFPAPAQEMVVEFDLFVAKRGFELVRVLLVTFGGPTPAEVYLSLERGGVRVQEILKYTDRWAYSGSDVVADVPPLGSWTHITWTLSRALNTLVATLTSDDPDANIPPRTAKLSAARYGDPAKVSVGIPFLQGPSSEWDLSIDNVVVRSK